MPTWHIWHMVFCHLQSEDLNTTSRRQGSMAPRASHPACSSACLPGLGSEMRTLQGGGRVLSLHLPAAARQAHKGLSACPPSSLRPWLPPMEVGRPQAALDPWREQGRIGTKQSADALWGWHSSCQSCLPPSLVLVPVPRSQAKEDSSPRGSVRGLLAQG